MFLQLFILGKRNDVNIVSLIVLVSSLLSILMNISSGYIALYEGQYEWMSENVENLLLQPTQEKILQSRLLRDEWKEFYESYPTFDPLLKQVEDSKEKCEVHDRKSFAYKIKENFKAFYSSSRSKLVTK